MNLYQTMDWETLLENPGMFDKTNFNLAHTYGNQSHHYQRTQRCCVSSSMPTRYSFLHLELRKGTQLWHVLLISQWRLGMVRDMVAVVSLDGSWWYV